MKNLKDYVLDVLFEVSSMFYVILDYHRLPINHTFCDVASFILSHKVDWIFWGRVYPDEKGNWRVEP